MHGAKHAIRAKDYWRSFRRHHWHIWHDRQTYADQVL